MFIIIIIGLIILAFFAGLNFRIVKAKEISLFGKHGQNFSSRIIIREQARGFPFIFMVKQKLVEKNQGDLPIEIKLEKDKKLKNYKVKAIDFKIIGFTANLFILILTELAWILIAVKGLHLY